jgi:hypothetical protein
MKSLAQCRGTSLIEARKLSRYIGFILRVMARVRVHILVGFVLGAGFCKNHDKQLTHIVRVSEAWFYFFGLKITVINHDVFIILPCLYITSHSGIEFTTLKASLS